MLPLLLACAGPAKDEPAPEAPAPPGPADIELAATTFDLGRVRVGEPLAGELVVTNTGESPLTLDAPILQDLTGAFVVDAPAVATLAPGESTTLAVTFSSTTPGPASAHVLLPSDDPDEPLLQLVVLAHAATPTLTLDPPALYYGTIEENCVDTYGLLLRNDGDDPLTVTGLHTEGADAVFNVDLAEDINGPLPWTIAPGEAAQVWVDFAPTDDLVYSGGLVVLSDDPANPAAGAPLDGVATDNDHLIDTFRTNGSPLDFVFAIGGTEDDALANALVSHMGALDTPLSTANVDYQVAAIRSDDGCLVNGLLPDGTMTAEERAAAMGALINAEGTEHTLTLLERALAEASTAGCNPQLGRREANVILVGLTDTASAAPQAVGVYVNAFEGAKADADRSTAWLIGPDGADCGELDTAWDAVATATGGASLSVCDDLSTNLATLAEASIVRQDTFPLSRPAWPDTVTVEIDGRARDGWSFDEATNSINFADGEAPRIASEVRAFYDARPECLGG